MQCGRLRHEQGIPELPPATAVGVEAAAYLGLSASTLRGLPIARRVHNSRRLYDIRDLDAYADDLPYEGETGNEVATCDRLFGV